MDLKQYKFPKVSGIDMAFSTFKTDKILYEEAIKRGFDNWNNPYHKLFSSLFFNGGRVVFKKDIEESFKKSAWDYCRAFMASFEPKHEEKSAICALIMSEILEPDSIKA
jgi:hypothetical protein